MFKTVSLPAEMWVKIVRRLAAYKVALKEAMDALQGALEQTT